MSFAATYARFDLCWFIFYRHCLLYSSMLETQAGLFKEIAHFLGNGHGVSFVPLWRWFLLLPTCQERLIYICDLASWNLHLTSTLEAHFAVSGRAWFWGHSMVVLGSPTGELSPSHRVWFVNVLLSTRCSPPVIWLVLGSLKIPMWSGGDFSLVATDPHLAYDEAWPDQQRRRVVQSTAMQGLMFLECASALSDATIKRLSMCLCVIIKDLCVILLCIAYVSVGLDPTGVVSSFI
jgi:hypothetical protein